MGVSGKFLFLGQFSFFKYQNCLIGCSNIYKIATNRRENMK